MMDDIDRIRAEEFIALIYTEIAYGEQENAQTGSWQSDHREIISEYKRSLDEIIAKYR
jgi:hypothetical protein